MMVPLAREEAQVLSHVVLHNSNCKQPGTTSARFRHMPQETTRSLLDEPIAFPASKVQQRRFHEY